MRDHKPTTAPLLQAVQTITGSSLPDLVDSKMIIPLKQLFKAPVPRNFGPKMMRIKTKRRTGELNYPLKGRRRPTQQRVGPDKPSIPTASISTVRTSLIVMIVETRPLLTN
ncbi:hypothetical protein [Hyphomicrobium sp. DY-1]|uniref:hypothetical protein n=1 Tax=Hyphomicrobium sp. DY-1 TaxID=3075650 RepID=UPI0039C1BAB0